MREEHDFSKSRKNPYASKLMRRVTLRLDEDVIAYFQAVSDETGIPCSILIKLYLRDCVASNRRLNVDWK